MIRLLLVGIVNFWCLSALAQIPVDIYRVETSVATQSEADRIAAIKANLGNVIVQVAGDAVALEHPLIKQAIGEAPNYLLKFSYSTDNTLVLNYSPQAIRKLLVQAQLMTAPSNAPQVIAIDIVNVHDFASFKQVQAYLKSIAVVRRVELVRVDNELMQLNLTLDGDVELLKTSLNASGKLQFVAGDRAVDDARNPLSFRWQNP